MQNTENTENTGNTEGSTRERTFKPSSWQAEVPDLVKEYNAWEKEQYSMKDQMNESAGGRDIPEEFNVSLVRRGLLNPLTGMPIKNPKQDFILKSNIRGFSKKGKENYDRIFNRKG